MDFKINEEKFDALQVEFLNRMMHSIKDFLSDELKWRLELEDEISADTLADLSEALGFAINAVIDGSDVIGDDNEYIPNLTFRKADEVVASENGTYLHEMTMGSLEEWLFDQQDDE